MSKISISRVPVSKVEKSKFPAAVALSAMLVLAMGLPAQAGRIVWNFDSGSMEGWTNKSPGIPLPKYYDLRFAPVTKEQSWDTTSSNPDINPGLGAYFLGETPGNNDSVPFHPIHDAGYPSGPLWPNAESGAHQTLWAQSPAFVLDGSGDLTFLGAGSEGAINPATGQRDMSLTNTDIPLIAGTWGPESKSPVGTEGLCAVGLRRDDGTFVLSVNFTNWGGKWNNHKFTVAQLAPFVNDGHAYTLNLVDALCGTGAWCGIDNVSVPGGPATLLATPSLQIWLSENPGMLVIRWKPTVSGQTQVLVSSDDLSRPAANWTVVQSVQTQNGATSVEIPLPTRTTFFRVRALPVYVDASFPSAGLTNVNCCSGDTVTFSLSGPSSLTYQWYKGGAALSGQTGPSLVLNNVGASDVGNYSVVVTSVTGNAITNSATVTIVQSVSVQSAPTDVGVPIGGSATFRITATGAGLTYKWYKGSTLLSGKTSNTLTVNNVSLSDLGGYTVVVSGTCGSATCRATLSTALPTADYLGNKFVTNAAPVLTFQRKLSPTLTGIDYAFPEQTAHGVALLSRFPPFTNSNSRIHVDGPWYDNPSANLHFSRGITSIGAMPNYRYSDSAPTTLRKAEPENKWMLMTDPIWYFRATELANSLPASDPRVPALRALGNDHNYADNEAAYRSLGYYTYDQERWPLDISGRFVRYPAIDIETTGNWSDAMQRNCNGWLYQGMAKRAAELGQTIIPNLYGQWQFAVGAFWDSNRQNGTGDPEYLTKDCLASPDPTLVACQENNGILSMDGYMQAIWGDEPFYKRNADTSLQLVGGAPVYNDITTSKAYGCNLIMETAHLDEWGNMLPPESEHCLNDIYRQAVRMYLQHHFRAGQYPANSSIRKSFLSNCKIGAWERYTNEGVLGINQNDRPVPAWLLDTITAIYLFTADDITVWSSDMNFQPGPLGANYTSTWSYNAHGVMESVVKAAHRYSANEPLHASTNTYQWCWFNLPVINQNKTAGDRYFEKPIAFGKLRPFEGHTYLELFISWPALDNTSKTFKVWIDKNGTRSAAYNAQLQSGRTYFYDAWQLPDTFTGLEGKHIQLRTTDMMGVQRTWSGDWRVPGNNSISTPSNY